MIRMLRPSFSALSIQKNNGNVLFRLTCVRFHSKKFDVNGWLETLDEAQQKRIRFIQNELTLQLLEEHRVPRLDYVTKDDFEHMLTLSQTQRHKYYKFLYKTYHSESAEWEKRRLRKLVHEANREAEFGMNKTDHIEYGLGKGSLIPKIYHRTIDQWKNNKALWHVMLNGPKLIYDLGYSSQMTARENNEAAKQLAYCFGLNRNHRTPFVLHFCNLNFDTLLWKYLHKCIPTLTEKPLPVQIHKQDILELFPKEKLVILTPDSPNVLREYNSDDHYVVSGIVDRGDRIPLSMAKARKYDIRSARLPLEKYRTCRTNKELTLDQVMQVMLEIKYSGDWNQAFRYVSSRKFI